MKIFVTGSKGMVGEELVSRGVIPLGCDVASEISVKYYLNNLNVTKDDLIINCAAITNVNACEENPQFALGVNAWGVHNLVTHHRGRLIQLSTDHVFSGNKWFSGGYSEKHSPLPVNVYGMTKLAGETMLLGLNNTKAIRTSKLFNQEFLERKLAKVRSGELQEFTNLIQRSFLHVKHFVDGLEWMIANWDKCPKILNISGTMIASYFGFFYQAAMKMGLSAELVSSRNYKLKDSVPRPFRGGLNVTAARKLGVPLYSYLDGLKLDD